jgi:hypothetical protein
MLQEPRLAIEAACCSNASDQARNDEVALADPIVIAPVNPVFASLNRRRAGLSAAPP